MTMMVYSQWELVGLEISVKQVARSERIIAIIIIFRKKAVKLDGLNIDTSISNYTSVIPREVISKRPTKYRFVVKEQPGTSPSYCILHL